MGGPAEIDGEIHDECDNFFESVFTEEGVTYHTAEQYFQCQKTTNTVDFERILKTNGPLASWSMGNQIKLRPDWEEIKVQKMYHGNLLRLSQNPDLAAKLCKTQGDIVFTGSTPFWNKWNGLIMERIRAELKGEERTEQDIKRAEEITQIMEEYALKHSKNKK
jgi:predicted NAD-dependent protein-ADP-ribosyltransferase YbiA (DUF1768 family)